MAEIEASRAISGQADPALAARAEVLLANAAWLAGDLAEQDRHGLRAAELARTAAGGEGLALALMVSAIAAIAGAGIQAATLAALDEAADLTAAYPDRFTETVMRHWRARLFATVGQLEAAETELGLCWAAGRSGAVRLVEFLGPMCEARIAAARGDATAAVGALRRAADGGHRVGSVMFVPAILAALACVAAIAGDEATAAAAVDEAPAELGGRRQAITTATLRYAEGVMAWHRGELAAAEHLAREATMQWHRGCDRMDACDGIEFLGVLAAARERFSDAARLLAAADAARRPLQYLAPGFTANRGRGRPRRQPGPARPRRRPLHPGMGRRPGTHPRRRGSLRRPQGRRPQTARHRLGQPDPGRTGGRPPGQRGPAERRHRPAPVHRPRHRQGAPVPHLRQARHHHPRRTRRTSSLTGSDRQI